jgi:hypothetical protein
MIGTMLAGTYESPGDVKEDRDGRPYKESYGMASARAVSDRTSGLDPFERAKKGFFREGISTSRVYLKQGRESVGDILLEILTGLQSAFTYTGATRCEQFLAQSVVGVQTAGGYHEGTAHGGEARPDPRRPIDVQLPRDLQIDARLLPPHGEQCAIPGLPVDGCLVLHDPAHISERNHKRRTSCTGLNDG